MEHLENTELFPWLKNVGTLKLCVLAATHIQKENKMKIEIKKDDDGYWLYLDGKMKALINLGDEHGEIVTAALEEAAQPRVQLTAFLRGVGVGIIIMSLISIALFLLGGN